MNSNRPPFLALAVVGLAVTTGSLAAQGLRIVDLTISSDANLKLERTGPSGPTLTSQSDHVVYSSPGTHAMFPLPWATSDLTYRTTFASARQDIYGSNAVGILANNNFEISAPLSISASGFSYYRLTVATDTANTPLDMMVHTFNSRYLGSVSYAGGSIQLGLSARISVIDPAGNLTPVWGFSDVSTLHGGSWTRSLQDLDVQGIGVPTRTLTDGWNFFNLESGVAYAPFTGALDFGLLQPGETFTLIYEMQALANGVVDHYGSTVAANFADPFGLGGMPPAMELQGLDYSAIVVVPEPATYAAWLGAGTLALAFWQRRRKSSAAH